MKNPGFKGSAGRGAWTVVAVICFVIGGIAAVQGVTIAPVATVMHQTYQMGWWILAVVWLVGGLVALKR